MSRQSGKNQRKVQPGNGQKPGNQKQNSNNKPSIEVREAINNVSTIAIDKAITANISSIGEIYVPSSLTGEELLDALKRALEAQKIFEALQESLSTREKEIIDNEEKSRRSQEKLSEDLESLNESLKELEREQEALVQAKQDIENRCKEVDQKTAELSLRELNAKAGFFEQYREVYDQAAQQVQRYQDELAAIVAQIHEQRVNGLRDLAAEFATIRSTEQEQISKLRNEFNQQVASEREQIETERRHVIEDRGQLAIERAAIERERRFLNVEKSNFREDKEYIEESVKTLVEQSTIGLQEECDRWKQQALVANQETNRLSQLLSSWESMSRLLGQDPDVILSQRNELIARVKELESQLADSPTENDLEKFRDLERERQDWESERYRMGREIEELKVRLSKARLSVVEHENLRDENLALEASRNLLRKELDDLREDIEGRLDDDSSLSPFPQCYSYDQDSELQTNVETEGISSLPEMVTEIQMRIARKGLYYTERDIRSFIGGLAMSRMMILQGISGTGKTSLPIEFAEAVGAGYEVIEVQAGWRDRDDLLGYYNAFEKKYYEKKFLQALYQAQCPAYKDRLFIMLLDEMNLSYVEQYFADLLSILQMRKQSDHKIDLIPHALPNREYPRGFVNNYRSIPVPPNVWFIGTANRDETTKDIADKTYDRAHIIELPERHPPASKPSAADSSPAHISYKKLTEIFRKTRETDSFRKELGVSEKFFGEVRPFMGKRFGIGFGSRLEKQVELYLPIICASGGTLADSIDDILAMRILRKIRDRYEIQYPDLEDLLKVVEDAWKKATGKSDYISCLSSSIRIIEEEKNKKRSRQAEEQIL